jgi:hypothetical protein
MTQWFQRCAPCGKDIPNGEMFKHLQDCEKAKAEREPRTPFHGKPNDPIEFPAHESPKV